MNQVIDKADELTKQRRELRLKILQEAILNSSATELQADFDGYGDSGSLSGVYSTTHDVPSQIQEELDDLFDTVLGKYVTFDWYNNVYSSCIYFSINCRIRQRLYA